MLADPDSGYTSFVSTGNAEITDAEAAIEQPLDKLPQMPTYHLKRADGVGDHAGQYWCRPLERQNRHGPYCSATAPCLADGGPLRGSA